MGKNKRVWVDMPEEKLEKLREEARKKGLCLASFVRMKLLEMLS
jgi:predicted DNA binding CopG/RHH family protein